MEEGMEGEIEEEEGSGGRVRMEKARGNIFLKLSIAIY